MKLWNEYHTPASVDEALALLQRYAGKARIVAGGTDLLLEIRDGKHEPQEALVDITSIPVLRTIERDGNCVLIGAGVTHSEIVKSRWLASGATCLVESCGVVGGPQVRNVATLGGNVAHALPAADGTTSLVALGAKVDIIYHGKLRRVSILEMFKGAGKSLLDSTQDMLLRFYFPLTSNGEASAFKRIMRPQGVALPVLGCAVWIRLNESHTHFEKARICIGPVAPTPRNIIEAEDALIGNEVNKESTLENAIEAALEVLEPRTSKYRTTADYRREMIKVLLRRTLNLAIERARTGKAIPEGVGV